MCSIPHCLEEGFQLENEERNITLKKGLFTLVFHEAINGKRGFVCGVNVEITVDTEVAAPSFDDAILQKKLDDEKNS